MALIVGSQLTALAESIVPALPGNPSQAQLDARAAAVVSTEDTVTKICQYIVDQMEIKNTLKVDAGPPLTTTITAGVPVPTDGGAALKTTMLAALPAAGKNAVIQNPGKGLIE